MRLQNRRKIAKRLQKIIKWELRKSRDDGIRTWRDLQIRNGIRRLAIQAQHMGLRPDDVLTDNGYHAFVAIAYVSMTTPIIETTLDAEWRLICALAGVGGLEVAS